MENETSEIGYHVSFPNAKSRLDGARPRPYISNMRIQKTVTLAELSDLAEFFPGDLVFLHGDLGAGKTAFVKAVAAKWGITEDVKSPTYVYYKRYGEAFYHFDLYRVEDYDTFVNIGGEEILDAKGVVAFVEWPDVISDRFSPTVTVRIEKTGAPEERRFEIERHRMP